MIRTHLFRKDCVVECEGSIDVALQLPEGTSAWVDIEAPTDEELDLLTTRFRFHPLAVEDCVHHQKRAKIERYQSHGFVVLTALDRTTRTDLLDTTSICIFIRPRLAVTVRSKRITAIERIQHILADEPDRVGNSTERVLHAILDAVIDEFTPLLDDWEDELDEIEDDAAQPGVHNLADHLVQLRRKLLLVRRIILPQIEVVRRLVDDDSPEVSAEYRVYFRDVLDHALVVSETTSLFLEVANGAITVHANAVNERLNEVMKFLAIVSTLLLPWTVVSGIFGMNFDVIPLSHQPLGFFAAVGVMVAVTIGLLYYFRRKGWLGRPALQ